MKGLRWDLVQDGYYRTIRYVDEQGMIVGRVDGTNYSVNAEWCASLDGPEGRRHIGHFVTEDEAKRAVEREGAKR